MKRLLLVIWIILLTVGGSHVDSNSSSRVFAQDNAIRVIKPAINESGWKIPGLEESRITSPRKRVVKGHGPDSVPLHVTVFRPTRKFITTIPVYRLKDGQTLIVAERKALIDVIIKCDVNGRTFMYILQCITILEEPNGRTGQSGMFGVRYFDEDGDGKFESFDEAAPFVTPDLHIPAWVLKAP